MSGGIRTSVKGQLFLQRGSLAVETCTVHENETIDSNLTEPQVPETSNGNIPCLPMLNSAAKSMASYGTRTRADTPPHTGTLHSTAQTEGEILLPPRLKSFLYEELETSTRNFKVENMVGEGGFGRVYKGWIDENALTAAKPGKGMAIAVKRLNLEGLQGHQEWLAEINYLGKLRHPNLVELIGYCCKDDERLLVFEFMRCGSLQNHLFRRNSCSKTLFWSNRMKILLGTAKALAFLHSDEANVIHRNIKSSNILLDSTYDAKLCSLGLAKAGPAGDKSHVSTRVMGTYGYVAPEYVATGCLTAKCDVFGFGVVMLEMLSGRRVVDRNRPKVEQNLVEWAKAFLDSEVSKHWILNIFDPSIRGQYLVDKAIEAAKLGFLCLSSDPKLRPNMNEVVKILEQLQESGDMECPEPSQNDRRQSLHASSNNGRKHPRRSFRETTD